MQIEPRSPALQVDSLPPEPPGKPYSWGNSSNSNDTIRQKRYYKQHWWWPIAIWIKLFSWSFLILPCKVNSLLVLGGDFFFHLRSLFTNINCCYHSIAGTMLLSHNNVLCSDPHLCLTLWDPMDCSSPGSSVFGSSQQEYWSKLPFPPSGGFPAQGLDFCPQHLLHWQTDSLPLNHLGNHATCP